jgi:cobyrinic acid a,c-diamide synthase
MHGFLIAAPQSGSGKTTVSLAIMAALVRRGLKVAPFKCGPDFIDPGYHKLVIGTPSINLDGWMCSEEFIRETFQSHCNTPRNSSIPVHPIAIIEGAMGLFDGIGATSKAGSSAQIAAITGAPVVLVINARGMAASAAALIKGFAAFDPQIRLAGVIFNNIGSATHGALLREALTTHCPDIICFGCIPRDESLVIPSRHLGLVTAEDNPLSDGFVGQLADMAERCLDLEGLGALEIPPCPPFAKWGKNKTPLLYQGSFNKLLVIPEGVIGNPVFKAGSPIEALGDDTSFDCNRVLDEHAGMFAPPFKKGGQGGISIAVARDAAFCFMYEDNLRLLREAGAELLFFSPLADAALPDGIDGLYLPGGYPELYAGHLDKNGSMKDSLRSVIAADMPVYAECGGFVYLTEGIDASEKQAAADFVGVFPLRCRMLSRRKALGYRQVELTENVIIGGNGMVVRGHEFHYSEIDTMPDNIVRSYHVSRQGVALGTEGYRLRNCLASYIHLHFGSNPDIARTFAESCRTFSRR